MREVRKSGGHSDLKILNGNVYQFQTQVHPNRNILGLGKIPINQMNVYHSTSYTSGAYAGNPNVFIRMDSICSGSYATIASLHKTPLESNPPSPYATSYVTSTGNGKTSHHIYCKPTSTHGSSRVSYYASSQLLQVPQVSKCKHNIVSSIKYSSNLEACRSNANATVYTLLIFFYLLFSLLLIVPYDLDQFVVTLPVFYQRCFPALFQSAWVISDSLRLSD